LNGLNIALVFVETIQNIFTFDTTSK